MKELQKIIDIRRKILPFLMNMEKLIDKAMNRYLPPFISAYQQNYSTQHVLIR